MNRIGIHEAKTRFSEMVEQVSQGDEFTITRRGVPVARLVPTEETTRANAKEALKRAKQLRETLVLGDLKVKDLIEEGRR